MRGAARQPVEEPPPERADLEAKADRVLDGHRVVEAEIRAVSAEIRDALRRLPAAACDQGLAVLLAERLILVAERQKLLAAGAFDSGVHLEEARGEMARYTDANEGLDHVFEQGRAYERELAAKAAVTGPRHRRVPAPRRRDIPGQAALFSVKGIAIAALVALKPLVPHLRHAGTAVKGAAGAHRIITAATAATLSTAGGAALITGAIVLTPSPGAHGAAAAGTSASVPGWHTSAVPIPSSRPIFPAVVHPKAKHAARGKTLSALGLPVSSYSGPAPSSSPAPSSASPSASPAPAGPATLTVSTTAIDLSGGGPATVTVSASGSGWASWSVSTTGTDLRFSPSRGVLEAGEQATITVSLAPSPDSLTSQTFSIAGQQVTVSLPLPVSVPSVLPTGAASPVASVVPSL